MEPFSYKLWRQASKKTKKHSGGRRKVVRMYQKGLQGVRGRKGIVTQINGQLGPDSHILAANMGRFQQEEAHSDICLNIISAILCFLTQELEVRYGVFVLYTL